MNETMKAIKPSSTAGIIPAKIDITMKTKMALTIAPKKSPKKGTKPVVTAITSAISPIIIKVGNGSNAIVTMPAISKIKAPESVIMGTNTKSINVGNVMNPDDKPQARKMTLTIAARNMG